MASIRGVILDVDGTLVDSNVAHAQSWVDALAGALADEARSSEQARLAVERLLIE